MVGVVRFGDMLLALIGVVVVTVYAVPSLLIAMALALPLSLRLAYSFLSLSQPLKHYEAATRSPVYSHFAEALAGLIVIRAYGRQPLFLARLHHDMDESNRAHYYLWLTNYYLSMRAAVAGATALAVTLQAARGGIDAAVAGLALTYALPFSQAVVFSIRSHAELELR
ncbi:atp-dependent bile acid permease [Nannochloropsis gaditana]|uniref:Atp-dependent bile acid permease n=1 Tax=Nannochloropsis gaditana TaxID=72520 RepID=W7TNZ7_9STRA|nr:atp-dependent bile acid permease [Nannochloropsis gaditana]